MGVGALLQLIRWKNLLIIIATQAVIKWAFFPSFGVSEALSTINFILLILATTLIAAGGYVINDIEDHGIDQINRPDKALIGSKISEKWAFNFYIALNVLGVAIGFYVAYAIDKANFAALFVLVSVLLYFYATSLKKVLLAGNFLVALLTAFVVLIVGVFDLAPVAHPANQDLQLQVMGLLLHYAVFAFVLNFIREIVKDIIDINGDKNFGVNSLPIAIGRERSTMVVFALGVFTLTAVLYYGYSNFLYSELMLAYFFIALGAPLLLFCIKSWSADSREDYRFLSLLLKITMVLGLVSLLIYPYK
ncbi:geranylgeranylglycerol-phosphate geranylgeranyltransferase [Gilvibacter sediminis]|uniref:geranylgeranylglycerol-phosphate geranylgeranyltransferase n=1 Tax=Gilvibacter sediminis TaxID=379071 RepID=UPI00234FD85C|nr:geranylgeranylglycerol-phosphate geranylgeranyltransferase [Gilvibacter sediminis]MDC7998190.1 geranylgeranylglycerol-phosphate geranylgeranyltransferase [Gilvibacter sediminis]